MLKPCSREGQGRARRHLLTEAVFTSVLIRERNRADRTGRPFGLFVVDVKSGGPARRHGGKPPQATWLASKAPVIDALVASTGDLDLVGWLKTDAVIGIITLGDSVPGWSDECDRLRARLRQQLARRLDPQAVERLGVSLHVYPEPTAGNGAASRVVDLILYPELNRRQPDAIYHVLKRGLDITGSLLILGTLSPLLLLIAALVKLGSRGEVVFRQVRIGQLMKPFTMLKFRTMYSGADHKLHRDFVSSFIKGSDRGQGLVSNGLFKLTNDPRITPIGRFLRKTSLDELPQLWNVLRGDMSLVGPRPPLPYELDQYDGWHRRRLLETKPGITGLWQVAGRSRTTFDEMVRLDLKYVRTRSLWTDLKILLATPAAVISGRGAG